MSEPRLLSNRYEIDGTLGYGGMSEVHRGRDIRLGRDVAVKVLRADLARDPTFQLRFRREAQNAAALNHPAIVAVYDTGETESENGPLPYIVMEYVDGRTLRDIVKSEGPLAPRRAMEVMADGSAALDFSHRHGIVHRDVKPANIMITGSGAVKVMDFGIARALADGQAAVTQTAAVIGTAQYLSPEQARGEAVDARSDVYASGCVLFELLTGEPPFTGDSPVAVAYQHVREDPRKPSDLSPQVPASLDAVVLKALSKNPLNRYQSAAEMRADLVRVLSGQRPKAPMIMSEEERTAMTGSPSSTDMTAQGRHREEPTEISGVGPVGSIDEVDERNRRKRRKTWLVALITAACVGLFMLVAWGATMLSGPDRPPAVPVPPFEGMETSAAIQKATAEGWKYDRANCASSPEDVNTIVHQDPPPNTAVDKNQARIRLCNGGGPDQVKVPDLRGKSMDEAETTLREHGLDLGHNRTEVEVSDTSLIDRIVSWENKGNTVAAGTTVNVTVGKQIQENPVPDVRNIPFDAAQVTLKSSGFSAVRQEQESDRPAGTVLEQSPTGGTKAKPNSDVTLTVSKGSQVAMPSLEGKSKSEAEQSLRQLGWNGQIIEQEQPTGEARLNNKVVTSNPQTGQPLRKDQAITLYIGDFDLSPSSSTSSKTGLIPFG